MKKRRLEKIKSYQRPFLNHLWLKIVILSWSVFWLFSCRPQPRAVLTPPLIADFDARLAAARAHLESGCYHGFRQAYGILQQLITEAAPWPERRQEVLPLFVQSVLLLGVREKEIGLSTSTLEQIGSLVFNNKELEEMSDLLEIALEFRVQGKGVMAVDDQKIEALTKGRDWKVEKASWERQIEERARRQKNLEKRASQDELAAYFWLTAYCTSYSDRESELKPDVLLSLFPRSRLIRFKAAICFEPKSQLLEELLREEPEFYEAHYFLGEAALLRGLLLTAEKHFVEARKAFPESPIIVISLASVAFALEELERSLELYEETLSLLPGYREAMLGRAICLSQLGRHEEAIKALQEMIDLGYWLLGEAHYWMAWNLHALQQNEEALRHCEEAKGRLPTNSEVYTLTGTVALELDKLDMAEKNLLEALKYDPVNGEALLALGRIEARRERWESAGDYFERSARAYEIAERALRSRITQIEVSEMSAERKQGLLRRKAFQLEKLLLTKATTFYHAASCYFNARSMEKAYRLADEAGSHPAFKEKAADLKARIRG